jgi:hypothetical protein
MDFHSGAIASLGSSLLLVHARLRPTLHPLKLQARPNLLTGAEKIGICHSRVAELKTTNLTLSQAIRLCGGSIVPVCVGETF